MTASCGAAVGPCFEDVAIGTLLPPLDVDVTTTTVVAGAIASRDFYPGHHDKDAAIGFGMKDVFMNVLTTSGWLGRYLTDWAGPQALVKSFSVRLGAPNYPGETMALRGEVVGISVDEPVVEVVVTASNSLGDHARATFTVELPLRADGDLEA